MSLFLSSGKNFYFTEDVDLMLSQSKTRDSSLVERKATKDDKLYSSLHESRGEMRLKKNSMVICQSQEKYATRASGNILETLSVGFLWPRHKKWD